MGLGMISGTQSLPGRVAERLAGVSRQPESVRAHLCAEPAIKPVFASLTGAMR